MQISTRQQIAFVPSAFFFLLCNDAGLIRVKSLSSVIPVLQSFLYDDSLLTCGWFLSVSRYLLISFHFDPILF